MEGQIFISYSRKDLDEVMPIKEELEANGFSCWMDLEGIESGSPEFTDVIAKAINGSSAVLFFLSEDSQKSRWSLNELRVARDNEKHVALVRFNNDRMVDKFKLVFGGADVIDWRKREQKEKLLRDLRTWSDEAVARPADEMPKKPIPFGERLYLDLDKRLSDLSHDIFISYSRKNKDVVLPIKEEIERALGLRCWIDLSDIPCGSENFKRKVIPGIKQTRIAFLFFLSAESQASEYAIKEIGFASKRANKRVILIRFNDDNMTDDFYFDFQNADIIDWRQPEQKTKLLGNLRAWANQVNEPHSPTATQKPSDESVKMQPDVSFVVCPICGKKNRMEDTFRCRECGRDNLCLRHQDEATFLCPDCKRLALRRKVQLWKDGPYWAETNIGAAKPWESGCYFWWGDTVGYKYENGAWMASDGTAPRFPFNEKNIPTCGKDNSTLQREGWITADGVLMPAHDAAHVKWDGDWRMPTDQELTNLCKRCDWAWTAMNGMKGYTVRGRGDYYSASIFLPATGYGYGTSLSNAGSYGDYWSSVPNSDGSNAWYLNFNSSSHGTNSYYRSYGRSVRPVQGFTK